VRVQDARNIYKRRVLTELQETRARLGEVETTLPTAREVREARIQQGGALGGALASELRRSVAITRLREGRTERIVADSTTTLRPGDIVEIRRDGQPDEGILAVGRAPRSDGELAALPDPPPAIRTPSKPVSPVR
jgi:hypothetical protein